MTFDKFISAFYLFNPYHISFGSPDLLDWVAVILIGITMWSITLVLVYFILYPLIWKRHYIKHTIVARITDKSKETHTTYVYNAATKTTTPLMTTSYYLTFAPIGKTPDFISGSFSEDMGSSCFSKYQVGEEVVLEIKENRRRLRLGSDLNFKYYGFETESVRRK